MRLAALNPRGSFLNCRGRFLNRGSSLIEVLVALFVWAIGCLGILALQTKSNQYNQAASAYSIAVYLANDIAERIRTNAPDLADDYADTDGSDQKNCNNQNCNSSDLVEWDVFAWKQLVAQRLPAGTGTITTSNYGARNLLQISISFDDTRAQEHANGVVTPNRKNYSLLLEI